MRSRPGSILKNANDNSKLPHPRRTAVLQVGQDIIPDLFEPQPNGGFGGIGIAITDCGNAAFDLGKAAALLDGKTVLRRLPDRRPKGIVVEICTDLTKKLVTAAHLGAKRHPHGIAFGAGTRPGVKAKSHCSLLTCGSERNNPEV